MQGMKNKGEDLATPLDMQGGREGGYTSNKIVTKVLRLF